MFQNLTPAGLLKFGYTNTTSAGSTVADATVVTNRAVIFVTGPTNTAATGIKLADPADDGVRSDEAQGVIVINNAGTNTLVIYPDTGGTIGAGTANAGITVAAKTMTLLLNTARNGTNGGTWFSGEIPVG